MSHIYESEGRRYLRMNVTHKNGEQTTMLVPLADPPVSDETNSPEIVKGLYKQVIEQSKIVINLQKQNNNKEEIEAAIKTLSALQEKVAIMNVKAGSR
jgi:hypothetical protein